MSFYCDIGCYLCCYSIPLDYNILSAILSFTGNIGISKIIIDLILLSEQPDDEIRVK